MLTKNSSSTATPHSIAHYHPISAEVSTDTAANGYLQVPTTTATITADNLSERPESRDKSEAPAPLPQTRPSGRKFWNHKMWPWNRDNHVHDNSDSSSTNNNNIGANGLLTGGKSQPTITIQSENAQMACSDETEAMLA